MARSVTTAPEAAEALRQAHLWLTQTGAGANGRARWEALLAARRHLREHPYLGSASPELPGRRQLVVSEYRVIYRVESDTGDRATAGNVRILAVLGPGQDQRSG